MNVNELREELSCKCKNGINFILSGGCIWLVLFVLWRSPMEVMAKTTWTFILGGLMFPLSILFARIIRAEWTLKDNPIASLGLYVTCAQILYFPLVFWAFYNSPYDMPMFLAIVTGAHFFPFAWFYMSKAYAIMAGVTSIVITAVGWNLPEGQVWIVPLVMVGLLTTLAVWLWVEYQGKMRQTKNVWAERSWPHGTGTKR